MQAYWLRARDTSRRLRFWDWVLWFGLGGYLAWLWFSGGRPALAIVAALLLATGLAQLAAHRWTWHIGLAAYASLALLGLGVLVEQGPSPGRVAMPAVCLWGLFIHHRERPRFLALAAAEDDAEETGDRKPGPKHSLVLWLRDPLVLDQTRMEEIAARAYRRPFNQEGGESFVIGKGANHVLRVEDMWFLVLHVARPWFDDPAAAAEHAAEPSRAAAVREHRAWLSIDLMTTAPEVPEGKIEDYLGRFLAELPAAGAEVVAVFHPDTGRIAPWAPELRGRLACGDPLCVFP